MTTEPMTPTDPIATPSVRDAAPARPLWQVILIRPVTMTVALLILEPIVASVFWPQSLDLQYILNSFTLTAPLALMALVLTLVIISGEIDLSPASSMALTACVFAAVLQAGVPFPLAVLICVGLGFLLGLFNAFLVVYLRLPSLIATIGTLTFYRGLAQVLAGDASIKFPEWYMGLNLVTVLGIPVPDLIVALAAILLALLLSATIFGRQIYQTGTNEVAAQHAGIRTRMIKTALFVALGVVAHFHQRADQMVHARAARMDVEDHFVAGEDLVLDEMRDPLGRLSGGIAGEDPIEIAVVERRTAFGDHHRREVRCRQDRSR